MLKINKLNKKILNKIHYKTTNSQISVVKALAHLQEVKMKFMT